MALYSLIELICL